MENYVTRFSTQMNGSFPAINLEISISAIGRLPPDDSRVGHAH
jgi:hypothetical protein